MEKEISIVFHNYKLLADKEFNLSDGSIFIVQGGNEKGKTTFVNALKAIMEVKDETVNPVTNGQKEGYIIGNLPGADDKQYQVRYDFNIDGKKKFTFIGPDNKQIKSVGDMRSIFNYTHFTVEEFYDWSKTAKGRQQQKDILLMLLSESERKEITTIDSNINSQSGIIYLQRQTVNREIESLNSIINNSSFTEQQKEELKLKEDIIKLFDKLTIDKKVNEAIINDSKVNAEKLSNARKSHTEYTESKIYEVERYDKEIAELEQKLSEKRLAKIEYVKSIDKTILELNTTIEELVPLVDENAINQAKIALNGIPEQEILGINERLIIGQTKKDNIIKLETINESLEKNKKDLLEKQNVADGYTENIKTLRERKNEIISNSDNIPHNYAIGDDYITVDGIPFVDTDLSKSHAIKAIAQLMMKVNKSPIMLMGDAEALGYPILDELQQEAEKNGKIMIFAEHVRTINDIKLVCYDDVEHEKEVKSTGLF